MIIILNSFFSLFFPSCRIEMLMLSAFFFLKEVYFPFPKMGSFQSILLFNDSLSFVIILMSCWISIFMILSLGSEMKKKNEMEICILILLIILCFFFLVVDKLSFFVFFESSLFPIFYMILNWGYQSERLKSVFYFFIYTIFFSIPFLVSLMYLNSEVFFMKSDTKLSSVWTFFLVIVLLVKLPLFFTHFWLPKAHVEAPVVGSMILAGVLLKMGGYGILRLYNFIDFNNKILKFIMMVSILGAVIISIVCLFCSDIKQLIAYSSVSHMNLTIFSMLEGMSSSMNASVMMMVYHGVCSSMMFFFLDLLYQRSKSRSLFFNKAFLKLIPISAFWLFLMVLSGSAIPPTMGSFSELLIFFSIFFKFMISIMFLICFAFFSSLYMIYMYYSLMHGNLKKNFFSVSLSMKESVILFFHSFFIWGLTFFGEFFTT